jgi:hypothetical protein
MPEARQKLPWRQRDPICLNQATAPQRRGTNWKAADIVPQPTRITEVRDALAFLTGTYAFEDEGQ